MSRISYDDNYSDYAALDYGRWQQNLTVVFRSKRGLKALKEVEQALLALPSKRLIADDLATLQAVGAGPVVYEGDVCLVGALALHKGMAPDDLARYDGGGAEIMAQELAKPLGCTMTFLYGLIEHNDETWDYLTPERRYEAALAWVQRMIKRGAQ